jgi:peptide/nickel transport system substrate-binding protein
MTGTLHAHPRSVDLRKKVAMHGAGDKARAVRPWGASRRLRLAAALAGAALLLVSCSSGGVARKPSRGGSHRQLRGGAITWAIPEPAGPPDWIFPLTSSAYYSVTNVAQFQYLMYRPLYWFGQPHSSEPTFVPSLSLAEPPAFSNGDETVTIRLKGWKFSNGQSVDAQSVVLWMNMLKAVGTTGGQWDGYVPGEFPDNVTSYAAPDGLAGDTVVFHLASSYSPAWFLDNELSQIVPMPEAWDVTSLHARPSSGGCGVSTDFSVLASRCRAVWRFDTDDGGERPFPEMAADRSTYATNPLWQVVDGPWRLAGFDAADGRAVFEPNPRYSGPQRPLVSKFVEEPFASAAAEYRALRAGGAGAPDVGFLPPADAGPRGTNPASLSGYSMSAVYPWAIDYAPVNFGSTGDHGAAGAIFRQLYVREALQLGIDQDGMIATQLHGFGVPTYGPVPSFPPSSLASGERAAAKALGFDPARGAALLADHGWEAASRGGVRRCTRPGPGGSQCGAGIPAGTPLSLALVYSSGSAALAGMVRSEVAAWAREGITVTATAEPFGKVVTTAVPCAHGCSWEIADWGSGWAYGPDYLPAGDETFRSRAADNVGGYSSSHDDQLIDATIHRSGPAAVSAWAAYLSAQLPVLWEPEPAAEVLEVSRSVGGVTPMNALLELMPEYWYRR